MRTLGILTVFDSQGIVDDYLLFYARSLRDAVSELIIVINGNVDSEGYHRLKQISAQIIIRDNLGYDAGGYKVALEQCGKEFILQYDQIVISNDTCFGPFIPFKTIFKQMEKIEEDWWGFEYLDNDYLSLLGTFFLVFRKSVINDVYDFFMQLDIDSMSRSDVVRLVELGLFEYLTTRKYKYAYYSSIDNYDMYKSPNYCTKKCNIPLMKKRCFDPIKYQKDNCIDLLKYIDLCFDYDIRLITDTIKRKYDIVYDLDYEFNRILQTEAIKVPEPPVKLNEIVSFAKSEKDIFIYGTGLYGKLIEGKIKKQVKIKGFVVSDDKYEDEYVCGYRVYRYSEICSKECKIIVAIQKAEEIKEKLQEQSDVLYLW